MQTPACSIVIPTKNGGALFQKVLDALTQQTLWNHTELIVLDSGSQDDTVSMAKQVGAKVIEILPQEFNHGATRDLGISLARSEYIILMVQDAVPFNINLLQILLRSLKKAAVAGVYARQIPQPDADVLTRRSLNDSLTGRTQREVRFIPSEGWYEALPPMEKYFFCNFDNVCSAINKSVWRQERFGNVNFGEDVDWAKRVLMRGYKIVYEPLAAVIHSHNRPMSYDYKRTYVAHRKLYALFGLHLVPSIKRLGLSWLYTSSADVMYILQHEHRLVQKIQMLFKAPILNLLSISAQYRAVQDEINGVSSPVKDV
jgi:glycosyltransferase involved in cell wall biosynthesis